MHSIATYPMPGNCCPAIVSPKPIGCTLKGLIDDHGTAYAVFETADGGQHILQVGLVDLLPFDSFRDRVREVLRLNIEYRGRNWFRDVMNAAERGGVEITIDQLTLAFWMGDDWISFDEARYIAEIAMTPTVKLAWLAERGAAG